MRTVLPLCLVFVFAHPALADEIDKKALNRAHDFLKVRKRGEFVNGFAHFGTKYLDHNHAKTTYVQDSSGRRVAGHFALVYDYDWSDGGQTQLAFLCDAKGNVYRVQSLASNGILQQPFAVANLSIKLVGEAVYEALKDNMSTNDRKLLRGFIDDADARGMLQLALRIQQATE